MPGSNKHRKTRVPSDEDLRRNPGIGTSRGTIKQGDETEPDGENTFEGDVESDATSGGGVNPRQTGRTNR
jgi:hypothetical protein